MSNRDKDAAMRFPAHCDLSPARVGMRVITKASRWDEKLQLVRQRNERLLDGGLADPSVTLYVPWWAW